MSTYFKFQFIFIRDFQTKVPLIVIYIIMKSNTKEQVISEQIDVVIMGSKSFELLQILLNKDLQLVPLPKVKNKYLNSLQSLYPNHCEINIQQPNKFPAKLPQTKIQKYTTNLLTQSFWLQFNFFYFGSTSYDPLLAGITRGKISLCIVVSNQQETDNTELKKLLTKETSQCSNRLIQCQQISKLNSNRQQLIMEHKIINTIHNFKINQFSSVLILKMIDKNRIIEGTSNIKLSRNQILRWIVDRYFQNQFGIKLRGQVGDQIQNYHEYPPQSLCSLM